MPPTKSVSCGRRRKTTGEFKEEAASRCGTKATTTPLVNYFFQSIFFDQMNQNVKKPSCYNSFNDLEEFKPCVVLLEKLNEGLETKIPAEKENIGCKFSKLKPCVVLLEKLDEGLETKIPVEKENIGCKFSKLKPCVVLLEKLDEGLETKIPMEKENIGCKFSKADKMEEIRKTPDQYAQIEFIN